MAVSVRSGTAFEPGTPHPLFSRDGVTPPLRPGYVDVSPDGRFVMARQIKAGESAAPMVTLVPDRAAIFEGRE